MELLGAPVISCIWSKETRKLDPDCFEGIFFPVLVLQSTVEYYHKSCS